MLSKVYIITTTTQHPVSRLLTICWNLYTEWQSQ